MKPAVKVVARGIARLLALPFYVSYRCRSLLIGERAFYGSSELLSLLPGFFGSYVRREFYRLVLLACDRNCHITFGTLFSTPEARIGRDVFIGTHCMIGHADIGDHVLLGSNVHLLSGRSQHHTADPSRPIGSQGGSFVRISIGEDTWIGNGAIVMANVGRRCVVGAGAIVVSDIPDGVVAVGNPARVVRRRATEAGAPPVSLPVEVSR